MSNKTLITRLKAAREGTTAQMQQVLAAPIREKRNMTPAEASRFIDLETEMRGQDERIAELEAVDAADATHGKTIRDILGPAGLGTGAGYTKPRGEIYNRSDNATSFFRDMYAAKFHGDPDARDRLEQNRRLVADARGEKRAISTTTGQAGELVPPLWLENQLVTMVRPGRVTANLAHQGNIPPGADTITIPKIATGTTTAAMSGQNTAVPQTDITTTSVASPIITIAGAQTVSIQLIEQSPVNVDEIILADLAADYSKEWDLEVLQGSGTSGHLTGVTTLSGTNSITWTQASPSLAGAGGMYSKLASAISSIHTTRFAPPDCIVMHPRRWAWALAQSDTQGRPMIVPSAGGPMNAMALPGEVKAEGYVGSMLGLDVYVDANISTTQGAGSNQDYALVMRASDLYAYEGSIRAEVFQQTYAQNLSVLCRLFSYAAFIGSRYPQSISVLTGSGFVAPSF